MTIKAVSKAEFKARALELFRHVESTGERVIVTDRGRPAVEIRRYRDETSEPLDALRGSVLQFDRPLEPLEQEDWEALE